MDQRIRVINADGEMSFPFETKVGDVWTLASNGGDYICSGSRRS